MIGELEQCDGRWRLRFTRNLPHDPSKVWRAITETEHLAAWFPQRIVGDWAPGAALAFEGELVPGFDGEVLVYEPPSVLEFRWGTDTLRFEISADGPGCKLVFTDTFDEHGKAARDAAGWHFCLDQLDRHLAGAPAGPMPTAAEPGADWAAVHERYLKALGPEASAIGIPGS